jgi:hypothetical protein
MNKSTKQRFRVYGNISLLAILAGVFFLPLKNGVTLLNDTDAAVLIRFYNEVVLPSPAGHYYDALLLKHFNELGEVYNNDPERQEKAMEIIQEFLPGIKALVNGEGDTVQINAKQVQLLETEVNWLVSAGSPSLREDIERELERYPLEDFIGMTMSEALDHVNTNFPADLIAEPAITPTGAIPTSSVALCLRGYDPDCLIAPTLVPDSGGESASYVFNNKFHFEYPSGWRVEYFAEDKSSIWLVPTSDSPEGSCEGNIYFFDWFLYEPINPSYDPLTYPQAVLGHSTPIWNRLVSTPDLSGSEFLWKNGSDSPDVYLSAIFYVSSFPATIEVRLVCVDNPTNAVLHEPDLVQEQYPNFHHIVESLRIWRP